MEEVMACSDDPQDSSTSRNLKSIKIRLSEVEAESLTSHQLCIVKQLCEIGLTRGMATLIRVCERGTRCMSRA